MQILGTITLPAHLDSLPGAIDFVLSCAGKFRFGSKRQGEMTLALEEALVNIFHYAYPGGSGDVEVTCMAIDGNEFTIEIADSGVPFDILSAPPPDIAASLGERAAGGLGIFFIRHFMDEVRYRREGGRNILTLGVYSDRSASRRRSSLKRG